MAKVLLFAPSSGLYSCPIAMTDGAAKIIEVYNYFKFEFFCYLHFNEYMHVFIVIQKGVWKYISERKYFLTINYQNSWAILELWTVDD